MVSAGLCCASALLSLYARYANSRSSWLHVGLKPFIHLIDALLQRVLQTMAEQFVAAPNIGGIKSTRTLLI